MSSKFILVLAVFLTALPAQETLKEHFDAGLKAESTKDWATALLMFRQAASLDPRQFAVWAHVAEAARNLAKQTTDTSQRDQFRAESQAAYEKAIELRPNDPGTHNNYALMLASIGNFVLARQQLDESIRLDPQNAARYYYNLGAVAVNDGRNREACEAFAASVQADPYFGENQYQNGLCFFARARVGNDGMPLAPPEARESLADYLRLSPAGRYADLAKELLASLDLRIETRYAMPGYEPPDFSNRRDQRFRGQASLLNQARPVYPMLAKRARIQGAVRLAGLIDRAGNVAALGLIDGHPLLVPAAMEAVKQWTYRPTLLNGKPTEVVTEINVSFQMSQ